MKTRGPDRVRNDWSRYLRGGVAVAAIVLCTSGISNGREAENVIEETDAYIAAAPKSEPPKSTAAAGSFALNEGQADWFDRSASAVTGWHYDEKKQKLYYFNEEGDAVDGWISDQGEWYYLEDGQCVKGWKEIHSDSGADSWYYFGEDGRMFSSCETPDGYYVNEKGAYVEKDAVSYHDADFQWNRTPGKEKGPISGLMIADYPAELYMLCIAGETSGLANAGALRNGDNGCAYGVCQLDYRYDLLDFMQFAYERHPTLWSGFENYLGYQSGSPELKGNSVIGDTFIMAMQTDYQTAVTDQLEYMAKRYWTGFHNQMNAAGFCLDQRSVAVCAAMFSVNVNCGPQPDVFLSELSPDMTDEELIRGTYHIRNQIFSKQKIGRALKGTTARYLKSEPQMALDLLCGYITIDSSVNYGGGVEWHGDPFYKAVTTVNTGGRVLYEEEKPEEILPEEETKEGDAQERDAQEADVQEAEAQEGMPPQTATMSNAESQESGEYGPGITAIP